MGRRRISKSCGTQNQRHRLPRAPVEKLDPLWTKCLGVQTLETRLANHPTRNRPQHRHDRPRFLVPHPMPVLQPSPVFHMMQTILNPPVFPRQLPKTHNARMVRTQIRCKKPIVPILGRQPFLQRHETGSHTNALTLPRQAQRRVHLLPINRPLLARQCVTVFFPPSMPTPAPHGPISQRKSTPSSRASASGPL